MAREIWIRAEVYGITTLNDGSLRPLARCGHCETGADLVHSGYDDVNRIHLLECWARGIVNSSNNVLVHTHNGTYAPLGKADGTAKTVYGMQMREIRNDFSRDKPIEFLPSKENAERMCKLNQRYSGHEDSLGEILVCNSIKPDLLTLKQLVFLNNMVEALFRKICREPIELDKSVSEALKKI